MKLWLHSSCSVHTETMATGKGALPPSPGRWHGVKALAANMEPAMWAAERCYGSGRSSESWQQRHRKTKVKRSETRRKNRVKERQRKGKMWWRSAAVARRVRTVRLDRKTWPHLRVRPLGDRQKMEKKRAKSSSHTTITNKHIIEMLPRKHKVKEVQPIYGHDSHLKLCHSCVWLQYYDCSRQENSSWRAIIPTTGRVGFCFLNVPFTACQYLKSASLNKSHSQQNNVRKRNLELNNPGPCVQFEPRGKVVEQLVILSWERKEWESVLLTDLRSVLRDVLGLRAGFWVSRCGYVVQQSLFKEGRSATRGIFVFYTSRNFLKKNFWWYSEG